MKETAERLGFVFSRKGCPCNGTPLIYKTERGNIAYQLTMWIRKGHWKLTANGCSVAYGREENLETKIKEIWDL